MKSLKKQNGYEVQNFKNYDTQNWSASSNMFISIDYKVFPNKPGSDIIQV